MWLNLGDDQYMELGSETVGAEPGHSQLEEEEPWVGGV